MYLIIPEHLLLRSDLSGDEKIFVSYLELLKKHGKNFFGGAQWVKDNLGISDTRFAIMIQRLLKDRVISVEENSGNLSIPDPDEIHVKQEFSMIPAEIVTGKVQRMQNRGFEVVDESESFIFMSNGNSTMRIHKLEYK